MFGVKRERLNFSFGTPTGSTKGRQGLLSWRGRDLRGPCSPAASASPYKAYTPFFGTPGYPSPLDRVRLRKAVSPQCGHASFSHLPRRHHRTSPRSLHHAASLPRLTAMTGDGLHSFSFSPGLAKGSFSIGHRDSHCSASPGHWLFRTFVGGGGDGGHSSPLPSSVLNPNKAIFTLNASSRILTANDMCSLLLGESEEKLCGGSRRLSDFISCPVTARYLASLAPDATPIPEEVPLDSLMPPASPGFDAADGKGAVIFSGRVVSVETSENGSQLCSLWLKGLPREAGQEQRWMAVLEPIEVTQAKATVDYIGTILDSDEAFRALFSFPDTVIISHLENIHNLIPSLQLPSPPPAPPSSSSSSSSSSSVPPSVLPVELEQQQCTGVSVEGSSTFPLCVQLSHHHPQPHSHTSHTPALNLDISVFSNISGLVVLDSSGNISDYNYNFTRYLFGYGHGELDGQSISLIIPSIFEDMGQVQELGCEEEVSTGSYWQEEDEDEEDEEELEVEVEVELVEEEQEEDKEMQKENKQKNIKPSNNNTTAATTTTTTTTASHSQAMRDITNSLNAADLKPQPQPQQQCLYNTWVEEKSGDENKMNKMPVSALITSTPSAKECITSRPPADPIEQGTFFGVGRHKDGSDLRVIYQIRRVVLDTLEEEEEDEEEMKERKGDTGGGGTGTVFYYMWILNDRDGMVDDAPSTLDLTRTSLHDTTELSLGHAITREAQEQKQQQKEEEHKQKSKKKEVEEEDEELGDETVDSSYCPSFTSSSECGGEGEHSHTCTDGSSGAEYSLNHSRRGGRHSSSSAPEEEKDVPEEGEFSQHYQILKQIGKGAFGCVKLSYRCSDSLLVVTKFIKKSKVYRDSWVDDMVLERRVPLEVSLLMSLDHPNIVTVLDVFENDKYFQLVMEKLGSGMDLFEFIDRNPKLDEFLAAHIFRQIVAALTYLHSLNIVHRDVKDENVIMDNRFHVKLIDFGSSAFTAPGKEFSQFAGTVEYCSPEVLMGNKYTGYEVEVWSLGVTLYTLMYWENPFYDVDETIKGVLNIPYEHSPELTSLLKGMMEKDVSARLTLPQVEKHPWTQLPCNPEQYTFHHVVHCSKRERNPKHYLRDYMQNGEDTAASSRSFLDEDLHQKHLVSTPPPLSIRRANSATTPRRPSHPNKNRDRLWSASPLSVCPAAAVATAAAGNKSPTCVPDRCRTPSVASCSTHSRASTTHSLSSIRSTITVDSASFSACSPHSSSPSSTTSPSSSSSSSSTTPTTATASDWANTQCKSTCISSTCQDSSTPLSDSTPSSDSGSSHSTLDDPCCPLSPCPVESTSCHHHRHHHTSSGDQHYSHGSSSCEGSQGACHSSRDTSCCSDHCPSWQESSRCTSLSHHRTKQDFLSSLFSYSSSSTSSSSSSSSSCSSSSSASSPESSPQKSHKSSNSTFNSDTLFYSEPFSFSDLLSLTDLDLMEGVLPHPCDPLWDDSTPDSP
ncbi:uncharacterized protein LOC135109926 isoform X3 [Scylla paramamosain]|uniref:uncharacterized protein LOC135109926 isoform X3 n=1 Tax=Scylla paramamosain TaxID=85552 RepID=UPI0030834ED6